MFNYWAGFGMGQFQLKLDQLGLIYVFCLVPIRTGPKPNLEVNCILGLLDACHVTGLEPFDYQ